MNEFFFTCLNALEGGYGWVIEIFSLIGFALAINIFLKWLLLKLHAHFQTHNEIWKDSFLMAIITPLTSLVWLFALIQILNFFLIEVMHYSLITTPHAVIKIGLILATAWFLLRWKKVLVKKVIQKCRSGEIIFDYAKVDALGKIFTLMIYFVTALLLLEQTGSSMNTLIAFGGVSGLALAFASQQIIANFFGGLMIYFTQPFAIDDWVKLPEKNIEGHVEEIGWYITRIRSFDKRPIYVPNSLLNNILVMNPSRMTHRQFKEVMSLRYQDVALLPEILERLRITFAQHPKLDQTLPVQIYFSRFGTYGIEIRIEAYTTIVDKFDYSDLAQELLFIITKVVEKYGAQFSAPNTVEIPLITAISDKG